MTGVMPTTVMPDNNNELAALKSVRDGDGGDDD